jgi:acetoin:2,6-dichlorophenolindophenol oxidoreductase subunit alpha
MLSLDLYKKMFLARRAEEKIRQHYGEDEMKTPMHMSMGEEAIAAGVCHALRPDDQVFATYRSHAIYLAKTGDVADFFAEMYGKDTARLKGKGGSMHMCAPRHGFMGTSAIVASIIPVAVGAAFASRTQGTGRLTTVFFGDGATEEGGFWESLNIACLMRLPVLFVCEDNGLAVHTPASARQGFRSITAIVSRFDCHVLKASSTDVEVIYNLTSRAVELIKTTGRPCFLHLKYYRYLEHVGVNEDFEAGYRPREEYLKWRRRDPIALQRKRLRRLGLGEPEIAGVENELSRRVEASVRMAREAPFAPGDELRRGVFTS